VGINIKKILKYKPIRSGQVERVRHDDARVGGLLEPKFEQVEWVVGRHFDFKQVRFAFADSILVPVLKAHNYHVSAWVGFDK
jgi:hypothetical protein